MSDPTEFGFTIRQQPERHREPGEDHDVWYVLLPHQCDSWAIHDGGYSPSPHPEAVASLERFIAAAQDALVALNERREMGEAT